LDNSLEAFSSNPRYSPDGLEVEIEKEELSLARKTDSEQAAIADLQQDAPKIETQEGFDMMGMHEKILGVVDNATRVPRDIVGGITKAIDNTMSLAIGRENVDTANQWLRDEMPDLVKIADTFEQGIAPVGTVSEVTQELSQFAVPFGAYMKGLKALSVAGGITAGPFTTGFISDVITSGTALDPHIDRFATLAKEMGVENKIVGWLADNENETDSEGRLKNILENAGIGLGVAAAIASVAMPLKGMWRLSKEIPKMPCGPSMGSPQAQRGSISLKDEIPSQFTMGNDEYYSTANGMKFKNNTPITDDELKAAYKESLTPKKAAEAATDYRIEHTAPIKEGKNTLDDVTDMMPDDFYDPSVSWNYYGHGGDAAAMDKKTARIVAKFKRRPNAEITIYRAAPKKAKGINDGDWVTVNKDYAQEHGSRHLEGDFKIISKKVKARDIATDGNSIHEWGYSPQKNKDLDDKADKIIDELKSL